MNEYDTSLKREKLDEDMAQQNPAGNMDIQSSVVFESLPRRLMDCNESPKLEQQEKDISRLDTSEKRSTSNHGQETHKCNSSRPSPDKKSDQKGIYILQLKYNYLQWCLTSLTCFSRFNCLKTPEIDSGKFLPKTLLIIYT